MATTAVPSKKKRTKGGRYSHEITREEIELYYHLPCEEASRQLGIGLTILKRICRRLGIEKWPYRQLKRAGKLGEAAAAAAAHAPPPAAAGAPPAAQAPVAAMQQQQAAGAPKGAAAARKRVASKKRVSPWEARDSSSTQDEDGGSSSQHTGGPSSSGSEGSWHAGHRSAAAAAPTAAAGAADLPWLASLARQGSDSLAPSVPAPQPASGGRHAGITPDVSGSARPRRVSIDMGSLAHEARPGSGGSYHRPASPQLSGSTAGGAGAGAGSGGSAPAGLQRQASGGLKRVREDEGDQLIMALLNDTTGDEPHVSPFSLVASALPEGLWSPPNDGGAWQPAAIGGGGGAAAGLGIARGGSGAEQLAAGLSRLAMRTLSLKRQCSGRGAEGEQMDALDVALLTERLDAGQGQAATMARACSAPAVRRSSPPLPRAQQQGRPPLGRPTPTAGTPEQGGWLAQEQLRLPLPGQQALAAAMQQQQQQQQQPMRGLSRQQGLLDCIDEPGEEGFLSLGDHNLSNLLFGTAPTPRHIPSSSDLVSEGCMLPEAGTATAATTATALHHAGSSGMLLECGEQAAEGGSGALQHASSSGSARLPQPGGSEVPFELGQRTPGALSFHQQLLGPVAGVTSVGPPGTEGKHGTPDGLADSSADLLSPFSIGSGPEEDREVDDLLADFLSPAPSNLADARMLDLLSAFSPRASPRFPGLDDPSLAGLARTPRPPSAMATPGAASLARAAALRGAALGPPPAMLAAAALSDPLGHLPGGLGLAGSVQGSPLTPAAGGSGSILSHDTPSCSGTGTLSLLASSGALDLPSNLSDAADLMPLVARLAQDPDRRKQLMAGQLMQMQAQQAQVQAQQALRAQQQAAQGQQRQAQQAAGGTAGMAAAWLTPGATAAAAPSAMSDPPSPGCEELQQAVELHQAVAQQYLQQRQEVQAMLAQRGSSQHLGALAGDQDRLRQLARLKQLKQQLAAAQARQLELRRRREAQQQQQQQQRSAQAQQQQRSAQAQQQQGQGQQQRGAAVAPASYMSEVGSAFSGGAVQRLGPPPPLPSRSGASPSQQQQQQHSQMGTHQQAQHQQAGQAGANSMAAMLQQWQWRAEVAQQVSWAPALPATQRASSAPQAWDFEWPPATA